MALNDSRIQVGKMRQQVSIVQPSSVSDTFGGRAQGGGVPLATNVWANIEPLAGRDAVAAQSFTAIGSHKIEMRWLPGVAAKQQVVFGSRKFQIEAVLNPDARTKKLILLVVELNDSLQQ